MYTYLYMHVCVCIYSIHVVSCVTSSVDMIWCIVLQRIVWYGAYMYIYIVSKDTVNAMSLIVISLVPSLSPPRVQKREERKGGRVWKRVRYRDLIITCKCWWTQPQRIIMPTQFATFPRKRLVPIVGIRFVVQDRTRRWQTSSSATSLSMHKAVPYMVGTSLRSCSTWLVVYQVL